MSLHTYSAEDQAPQFVKLLIHGEPGAGKTKTSCIDAFGVETPGPILFINAEGGTLSLRGVKGVQIYDLSLDPKNPKDFKDGKPIRDSVDKLMEAFAVLKSGKHPYKTVILDSITELQKIFLDRACKDTNKGMPELRQWGIAQQRTRDSLRAFRDLPLNVILIALSQETKDEGTGEIKIKPSLSGKVADEVAGFMDQVAYMAKIQTPGEGENAPPVTKRVWIFEGGSRYVAKDRSGVLKATMPASFTYMYDAIFGTTLHPKTPKPQANEGETDSRLESVVS